MEKQMDPSFLSLDWVSEYKGTGLGNWGDAPNWIES